MTSESARVVNFSGPAGGEPGAAVARARVAQPAWAQTALATRRRMLRGARRLLAVRAETLATTVRPRRPRPLEETVSAELLPLADACRFLEKNAHRLLRPRRLQGRGPFWLGGVRLEQRREPLGVVLVIGPGNYPLFLPGVQTLQALAAGNAVLLKPAPGCAEAAAAFARLLADAGLPDGLLTVLPETVDAARAAIAAGVDKVALTGSAETGRRVLAQLAERLTPATVELSGCDAAFVRADADLDLAARALAFGATFNGGATCIAPRRVFVARPLAAELERRLAAALEPLPEVPLAAETAHLLQTHLRAALAAGARPVTGGEVRVDNDGARVAPTVIADATPEMGLMSADLMAPVLALCAVEGDQEALVLAARCPYALGASVFSRGPAGRALANRVRAGVVVVNDLIAPTADPRIAFGGRGESGFGLTRGPEGLLEMTALKTIVVRSRSWRPHLAPPRGDQGRVLLSLMRALHGPLAGRLAAIRDAVRAAAGSRKSNGKES